MSIPEEINSRIFAIMDERNITGYRIMKDLNIPQGTISQARHNKASFTVQQLIKIAKYLNVSLDWLLTGENSDGKLQSKINDLSKEVAQLKNENRKIENSYAVFDKISDIIYNAKSKKK